MSIQNLFIPALECSLDSNISSNVAVMSGYGYIKKVSEDVKIYKNGELLGAPKSTDTNFDKVVVLLKAEDVNTVVEQSSQSQSDPGIYPFVEGDQIYLVVKSSSSYADQTYGIVDVIRDSVKETHIFACVTLASSIAVLDSDLAAIEPYELTQYKDETPYYPNADENEINIYDDILDLPIAKLINLGSIIPEPESNQKCALICEFYTKKLYKVSFFSNKIIGIVQLLGNPHTAIYVPKQPRNNLTKDIWVTLTDLDKVVVIDDTTDQVLREFSVGDRPLAIAIDRQYENVWIANNASNTVTHLKWNAITKDWDKSQLAIGNKPYGVACDIDNNAWITCADDDKVYKITPNEVIESYVVGEYQRGITYSNGKMWIALAQDSKIVSVNLNGTIASYISNVGALPFDIKATPLAASFKWDVVEDYEFSYSENISAPSLLDLIDSSLFLHNLNSYRLSDSFILTDKVKTEYGEAIVVLDEYYNQVVLHITGKLSIPRPPKTIINDQEDSIGAIDFISFNPIADILAQMQDSVKYNSIKEQFSVPDVLSINKPQEQFSLSERVLTPKNIDTISFGESTNAYRIADQLSFSHLIKTYNLSDSFGFIETIKREYTEIISIDELYNYVTLHVSGNLFVPKPPRVIMGDQADAITIGATEYIVSNKITESYSTGSFTEKVVANKNVEQVSFTEKVVGTRTTDQVSFTEKVVRSPITESLNTQTFTDKISDSKVQDQVAFTETITHVLQKPAPVEMYTVLLIQAEL